MDLPGLINGHIYQASNDGSNSHTGDFDWISFRVATDSAADISLSWDQAQADYDLYLLEDGEPVAGSSELGSVQPESISRNLTRGSTWTVLVAGWSGPSGDYQVLLD